MRAWIKLQFCRLFNHFEDFLDWVLPGEYPDRRPWLIRTLTSWIATLAVLTDEEAMKTLRRAVACARSQHMRPYTYEEVFGEK